MYTINDIPVFRATLADDDTGMLRVSLVDCPAVETPFVSYDADKALRKYSVADEEKRIVFGVLMRANFPIYRYDETRGEYYIVHDAETIRSMAEKYLAEKRENNVNIMHEEGSDVDGVQMVQIFIKDSAKGIAPEGFEDVEDGSLFAEYHVLNDEVWEDIKAGTYKGFSIEILENLERFNKMEQKKKTLREALRSMLADYKSVSTDNGVLQWDGDEDLKVGDEVSLHTQEDELIGAPDGDYKTEDGKTIVVADGKVSEIKEEEANNDEPNNEPQAQEMSKQSFRSALKAYFSKSYDEKVQQMVAALESLIDKTYGFCIVEAGDDYCIAWVYNLDNYDDEKFYRYAITWENDAPQIGERVEVKRAYIPVGQDPMSAEEFRALQAECETLRTRNAELEAENETFRKTPAAQPAHAEYNTPSQPVKGHARLASILGLK